MTTASETVRDPARHSLDNALWKRQLYRYPNTLPRIGYLSIVVLTTIMLYYLYYVEGAVTPLMLPYYHMSFEYFLYLLVVSNAIGAFSAFIGGLSDKIGRANLTIFGTSWSHSTALRCPQITDSSISCVSPLHHRLRQGVVLVQRALMRELSTRWRGAVIGLPALGPTMGALSADFVAISTLSHLTPWRTSSSSRAGLHRPRGDRLLLPARTSPQLRDRHGHQAARGLVRHERRTSTSRGRSSSRSAQMKIDLVSSSIAISVFLLFY